MNMKLVEKVESCIGLSHRCSLCVLLALVELFILCCRVWSLSYKNETVYLQSLYPNGNSERPYR